MSSLIEKFWVCLEFSKVNEIGPFFSYINIRYLRFTIYDFDAGWVLWRDVVIKQSWKLDFFLCENSMKQDYVQKKLIFHVIETIFDVIFWVDNFPQSSTILVGARMSCSNCLSYGHICRSVFNITSITQNVWLCLSKACLKFAGNIMVSEFSSCFQFQCLN